MHKVSSEIYNETNFEPIKSSNGKVVSKFKFEYPNEDNDDTTTSLRTDKDGDLVVRRRNAAAIIEIEHSEATELRLVGLQVWRGALLMADFFFDRRAEFKDKQILELGAGCGLTSIAAAIYARQVICTDVDIGGILELIRANAQRNSKLLRNSIKVLECDFTQKPQTALLEAIDQSDVIVAADVIYDTELTDAFIRLIDCIFAREIATGQRKTIYVSLEKRFVFTFAELDSVAPMFEYFIKQTMDKPWRFEYISLNFPQYFVYERCKHLVLMKLTSH